MRKAGMPSPGALGHYRKLVIKMCTFPLKYSVTLFAEQITKLLKI